MRLVLSRTLSFWDSSEASFSVTHLTCWPAAVEIQGWMAATHPPGFLWLLQKQMFSGDLSHEKHLVPLSHICPTCSLLIFLTLFPLFTASAVLCKPNGYWLGDSMDLSRTWVLGHQVYREPVVSSGVRGWIAKLKLKPEGTAFMSFFSLLQFITSLPTRPHLKYVGETSLSCLLFLQRFTSAGRPTLCMGGTMPQAGISSWIKREEKSKQEFTSLYLVTVEAITAHSQSAFLLHHRKPQTFNLEVKGIILELLLPGILKHLQAKGANTGSNLCDCFWNGTLLLTHSVIWTMGVNTDISTGSFLS